MKKYITLKNIGIFYILILLGTSFAFPEYNRYVSYSAIVIMVPLLILKLVKQREEDKVNGTQNFKFSIYNVLMAAVFMGILFYLIHSNYPSAS
ncbi:hypothetical protein [Flavobacterium sp. N1736]|uniref:hypothetical protein n=1 Tax=Flavobacterium sp. N1736 TaxID=2986823 RepID=UPI00222499D4|nr:hypothetical protein [Flavobacterium sp. N1736]